MAFLLTPEITVLVQLIRCVTELLILVIGVFLSRPDSQVLSKTLKHGNSKKEIRHRNRERRRDETMNMERSTAGRKKYILTAKLLGPTILWVATPRSSG